MKGKAKTTKAGVAKKGISAMAAAKKKFAAKSKDVGVMIKVKDDDGKIVEFEQDEPILVPAPAKKKKVKAKTVRVGSEANDAAINGGAAVIDAEDTLAMIKNALKSGNITKEMQSLEAETAGKGKKPKKVTSTKKKDKMPKLEETTQEDVNDDLQQDIDAE